VYGNIYNTCPPPSPHFKTIKSEFVFETFIILVVGILNDRYSVAHQVSGIFPVWDFSGLKP
jgi:hypothetical protein